MIIYDDWIQLNETVVKHFTNVFDIAYHKTETELQKLFAETPSEMNIRNRVKRLNAVYGTRISEPDQVKIAAFIKKENIVGLALSGDYGAVEKLALDEIEDLTDVYHLHPNSAVSAIQTFIRSMILLCLKPY